MGVRSWSLAKGAEPLLTPCLRDLTDNVSGDGFARVDRWPAPWVPAKGDQWIHEAFVCRDALLPSNSRPPFRYRRTTDPNEGWQGTLRSGGKRSRSS